MERTEGRRQSDQKTRRNVERKPESLFPIAAPDGGRYNILTIIIIIIAPIAVETLGPTSESASDFFSLLAKKMSHHSGDERETAILFQRVSVLVQRFNGVLLHESFVFEDCPE